MLIGMLHFAAPPIVGGVESVIAHHAAALVGYGHTVEVIAGRGGDFHPQVTTHLIPLVDSRAPEIEALRADLSTGQYPQAGFEAAVNRLRDALLPLIRRYDALIVHNVFSMNMNLPLTALLHQLAASADTPTLIAWHHDMAWTLPRYLPQLHDGYPWDLLRTPSRNTIHVTVSAPRKHALVDLMGLPAKDIHVVPGGVDTLQYWGISGRVAGLLRELRVFDSAPLLLLPARLTRRKNIEYAIRVTAALRQHTPQPLLIVTGPSDPHNASDVAYLADLRQLVSSLSLQQNVRLLADYFDTPPDVDEVVMLYRAADAMLLPSKSEGFGLPMLEAALMRLPIFCTDLPTLKATGGAVARYFSLDDAPEAVAEMIYGCLQADPATRLRRKVLNSYDWDRIVSRRLLPLLETTAVG